MPVRHFYLLSHYICNGLLFLFSACWLQKDECNSLWRQLRGRRQMSITTQKVFLPAIFTCSHITFAMVYYFYFLLVGSRRNECNSLREQLRGRRQMSITTQKVFLSAIFTCSHSTFVMVYYFYFLCFGSRRNECNSLLGREGGEVRSLLLTLSAMLNLFSSFTDDKMILKAITIHDKFIIILSRYIVCLDVCHALHDAHLVARIPRYS